MGTPDPGGAIAQIPRPVVAIAHDYLTQRGGAERVVLAMSRAFPEAPIYTTLYDPDLTFAEFRGRDVRVSPLNAWGALRRNHRLALPFLPLAASRMRAPADVLLCSSSGWSHGFRTDGKKLVYCYTPARWLYQREHYLGEDSATSVRAALRALTPGLRWWDKRQAAGVERYLAISRVVRERIREAYGVDSDILPAPIPQEIADIAPVALGSDHGPLPEKFLLCVSRLLPYKNVDAVIEALRLRPRSSLVVVGRGPEEQRLRRQAPPNVCILSGLSDGNMRWLYENCTGLVAASHEDFGLTPLEAAAAGKPSAVLRAGGYLDTMTDQTAVFFDHPTPDAIAKAIDRLARGAWEPSVIRRHTEQYSEQTFIRRLQSIVADLT
ncbi:glycosyltransferase [Nocardioides sp. cx-173]|uniref:glycosyltransferase n=1 Tax=Nocardioides sp. cx-173 TaxID=2898796 RepID=UPI001E45516F|nr:glycosyltransferase [Nocardioides sp. cx-173]MCD4526942.1 glycosyltransferase [Nocardioides sp. cx-173]UGB41270.1 glycosyltransferase [Nocardioides sp. cx-173]